MPSRVSRVFLFHAVHLRLLTSCCVSIQRSLECRAFCRVLTYVLWNLMLFPQVLGSGACSICDFGDRAVCCNISQSTYLSCCEQNCEFHSTLRPACQSTVADQLHEIRRLSCSRSRLDPRSMTTIADQLHEIRRFSCSRSRLASLSMASSLRSTSVLRWRSLSVRPACAGILPYSARSCTHPELSAES